MQKADLLTDMSVAKEHRSAGRDRTWWMMQHASTPAEAKKIACDWEAHCKRQLKIVLAYADDHSSWDDEEGLPEEETVRKQGNNKKKARTVNEKLATVDLVEIFADAGLSLLQGRRLCREYLKDTRKTREQ